MTTEERLEKIEKMVADLHRHLVPKSEDWQRELELLRAGDIRGARRIRDARGKSNKG